MNRVFVTGDKHGDFMEDHDDYAKVKRFCDIAQTDKNDVLIVLGDHGTTYYGPQDKRTKRNLERLEAMPITFVMIRGNHDQRPFHYCMNMKFVDTSACCGMFNYMPEYPDILYTDEYGWYRFAGHNTFVIGGAYSIDKQYRLERQAAGMMNYRWFWDEQLSKYEMERAYRMFESGKGDGHNLIMSHTCPFRYRPNEALMCGIDESMEDNAMELWMNDIDDQTVMFQPEGECYFDERMAYDTWYCGHWHIDKNWGRMRFMYHDIIELEPKR